jgi:hypothetical protein
MQHMAKSRQLLNARRLVSKKNAPKLGRFYARTPMVRLIRRHGRHATRRQNKKIDTLIWDSISDDPTRTRINTSLSVSSRTRRATSSVDQRSRSIAEGDTRCWCTGIAESPPHMNMAKCDNSMYPMWMLLPDAA